MLNLEGVTILAENPLNEKSSSKAVADTSSSMQLFTLPITSTNRSDSVSISSMYGISLAYRNNEGMITKRKQDVLRSYNRSGVRNHSVSITETNERPLLVIKNMTTDDLKTVFKQIQLFKLQLNRKLTKDKYSEEREILRVWRLVHDAEEDAFELNAKSEVAHEVFRMHDRLVELELEMKQVIAVLKPLKEHMSFIIKLKANQSEKINLIKTINMMKDANQDYGNKLFRLEKSIKGLERVIENNAKTRMLKSAIKSEAGRLNQQLSIPTTPNHLSSYSGGMTGNSSSMTLRSKSMASPMLTKKKSNVGLKLFASDSFMTPDTSNASSVDSPVIGHRNHLHTEMGMHAPPLSPKRIAKTTLTQRKSISDAKPSHNETLQNTDGTPSTISSSKTSGKATAQKLKTKPKLSNTVHHNSSSSKSRSVDFGLTKKQTSSNSKDSNVSNRDSSISVMHQEKASPDLSNDLGVGVGVKEVKVNETEHDMHSMNSHINIMKDKNAIGQGLDDITKEDDLSPWTESSGSEEPVPKIEDPGVSTGINQATTYLPSDLPPPGPSGGHVSTTFNELPPIISRMNSTSSSNSSSSTSKTPRLNYLSGPVSALIQQQSFDSIPSLDDFLLPDDEVNSEEGTYPQMLSVVDNDRLSWHPAMDPMPLKIDSHLDLLDDKADSDQSTPRYNFVSNPSTEIASQIFSTFGDDATASDPDEVDSGSSTPRIRSVSPIYQVSSPPAIDLGPARHEVESIGMMKDQDPFTDSMLDVDTQYTVEDDLVYSNEPTPRVTTTPFVLDHRIPSLEIDDDDAVPSPVPWNEPDLVSPTLTTLPVMEASPSGMIEESKKEAEKVVSVDDEEVTDAQWECLPSPTGSSEQRRTVDDNTAVGRLPIGDPEIFLADLLTKPDDEHQESLVHSTLCPTAAEGEDGMLKIFHTEDDIQKTSVGSFRDDNDSDIKLMNDLIDGDAVGKTEREVMETSIEEEDRRETDSSYLVDDDHTETHSVVSAAIGPEGKKKKGLWKKAVKLFSMGKSKHAANVQSNQTESVFSSPTSSTASNPSNINSSLPTSILKIENESISAKQIYLPSYVSAEKKRLSFNLFSNKSISQKELNAINFSPSKNSSRQDDVDDEDVDHADEVSMMTSSETGDSASKKKKGFFKKAGKFLMIGKKSK